MRSSDWSSVVCFSHLTGDGSDFCKRYGLDRLVYAEPHDNIGNAIAREKALKKWNREWKFRLIEESNPDWLDLFAMLNHCEKLDPRLRGGDGQRGKVCHNVTL